MTIANGGTIALAPGEKALITVTAQADTKRVADANGILTVTAQSAYLKSKPSNSAVTTYTATNTDNALTKTPLYAITKSAITNLGNSNLDLNNATAYVDYTITVKNEGNIAGTAISISDDLPSGLVAIASGEANYVAPTVTASNGSAAGTAVISNANKTITVAGQNIKVGETITVTFRAKKQLAQPLLAHSSTMQSSETIPKTMLLRIRLISSIDLIMALIQAVLLKTLMKIPLNL